MSHTVFLSIGSNIGNTVENCSKALEAIAKQEDIKIIKTSSFYRTEPWCNIEQDWFTNCVVKIETPLPPIHLFKNLQQIEMALGKNNAPKGYPRIIDVDVLFFGNMTMQESVLTIPHPLLCKRAFVLIPFLEVEPLFIHPTLNKTIMELSTELEDKKGVVRLKGI